jgi:hypothetical protein
MWRRCAERNKDPDGPPTGTARVFRQLCRSGFRYWDAPTYRDYFLGFRVSRRLADAVTRGVPLDPVRLLFRELPQA